MTAETKTQDKPFLGVCGYCNHVWPIAFLPMDIDAFAKLAMGSACPMCAGKKVFVATAEQATIWEQSHGTRG